MGIVLPYALRVVGVSAGEVLTASFVPALLPVAPMAIALCVLGQVVQPASLLAVLAVAGTGLFVYGIAYLGFGARACERQICRDVVIGTIGFVTARLRGAGVWRGAR